MRKSFNVIESFSINFHLRLRLNNASFLSPRFEWLEMLSRASCCAQKLKYKSCCLEEEEVECRVRYRVGYSRYYRKQTADATSCFCYLCVVRYCVRAKIYRYIDMILDTVKAERWLSSLYLPCVSYWQSYIVVQCVYIHLLLKSWRELG